MFQIYYCQHCNKEMKIHSDYQFRVNQDFCSKDCGNYIQIYTKLDK